MIKIEKLKDGAKVFVIRNGKKTQVFLNQLISDVEFETIEVEGGTLVYSINETEIAELSGSQGKQIELNLAETVQDTVVTQEAVQTETAAPAPVVEAPTIVIPRPRAKK